MLAPSLLPTSGNSGSPRRRCLCPCPPVPCSCPPTLSVTQINSDTELALAQHPCLCVLPTRPLPTLRPAPARWHQFGGWDGNTYTCTHTLILQGLCEAFAQLWGPQWGPLALPRPGNEQPGALHALIEHMALAGPSSTLARWPLGARCLAGTCGLWQRHGQPCPFAARPGSAPFLSHPPASQHGGPGVAAS